MQMERVADERMQAVTMAAKKIAHEINNALATMRNYLYILSRKNAQGEAIGDELTILDTALEHLGYITLGLENLAQEQSEIRLELSDVHRLIEETLRLFQLASATKGQVGFTYVAWLQPLSVRTDRHRLSQILQNLLGNAVDAVGGQGQITVRTTVENDETLLISVEDDGPGIDPGIAATLFMAGASTKGGSHGGLGLVIVRKLANQLSGSISHRSQPGQTVFTIALPA